VPFDLSSVGMERKRTVGIEIVAADTPVRAWIADAPDDGIARRIVAAGDPCTPPRNLEGAIEDSRPFPAAARTR
jgi:hypothetical protein